MPSPRDILLVSKDRSVAQAHAGLLPGSGYQVRTAAGMQDALPLLASGTIGLILCDLTLEDISAADFLISLKKDPRQARIPFLFFIHTRNQGLLTPRQALALGADDYIVHPIDASALTARIKPYLPEPEPAAATPPAAETPPADDILKSAHVSVGGLWIDCRILNHTSHGAMVETEARARQGGTVKLRYALPEGQVMATGKLIHILMGDHGRPMGMGINFRGDSAWRQIERFIKAWSAPWEEEKVSVPAAENRRIVPDPAIGIEVSRDGVLWIYGELIAYDKAAASIKTPVLGKPGETFHLRCVVGQEQKTLSGRIEKVTLNDLKQPAGMELQFDPDGPWAALAEALSPPPPPPKAPMPAWLKTALAENTPTPEDALADTIVIAEKRPQLSEPIETRFYKSLIGKTLGNYEIVSFLSAGSMGGVFKGWDIALERHVALKVISYTLSSQQEFVEMFFKEARLVSKLNHENIAHIYFIGNESGIVYYAMEFIQGGTLASRIQKQQRLPETDAVRLLVDACRALDRVWEEKIIHRDIKPANIMISETGAVKIVDFGVAHQQKKEPAGPDTKIVGSPPYLSPETIREEPVDFRSDIYSLGATFYHVLAGAPPFMSDSLEGMLQKHLSEPPVPLAQRVPGLSPCLSDIIGKMLAKTPEARFQSYRDIIEQLSPLLK